VVYDYKAGGHALIITTPRKSDRLLEHLLFNLSQLSRAVGAWRFPRRNLGLRSLRSLQPRLAYDGPLALKKFATN
jgi:hypothetical protein